MDEARFARPAFLNGVELVTVSYRKRVFPVHVHDAYVVGTVVSGAEALRVHGRTHTVSTGDVLRLHPNEAHSNRSLGEDVLRYRVFYLSVASIDAYCADCPTPSFSSPVVNDSSLAPAAAQLPPPVST